jgi:hypothetical protein
MPKISGTKLVSLQLALVAGFVMLLTVVVSPAVGQTENTNTGTNPTQTSIPDNSEYNGTGQSVPVRKDAWTWYWNEKAHIETNNSSGFWGDDAISNLFKNVCNSVLVPVWNGAMEYDFVRAGVLLIVAGMLLGLGAKIVLPKKPENQ